MKQRGRVKSDLFRKGIIKALLKCGFQIPEKHAMDELIDSLDMEQRGYVKFSALSGILIGSNDNITDANTGYRGIPLINTIKGTSKKKKKIRLCSMW